MAEITKSDYIALHTAFNNMLCELATTIIAEAMLSHRVVDSQILLAITQKYTEEVTELTKHIVGE